MQGLSVDTIMSFLTRAIVLFTAMPVHECAHGYIAGKLGDNTARERGRLTLNPLAHIDPIGTLLMFVSGFGWARPVPVDPRNFKHPRRDMALTALAGPVSNMIMALVLLIIAKLLVGFMPGMRESSVAASLVDVIVTMLYINLYLAVFNLLPVPPLDGSKIIGIVFPDKIYFGIMRYERYISLALFALLFTGVLSTPLMWLAERVFLFLDLLTLPINLLFR